MPYTVHEVAELSGVTIKTLYHYQKIGLLMPESIAENGYRYYGEKELKRLQHILSRVGFIFGKYKNRIGQCTGSAELP